MVGGGCFICEHLPLTSDLITVSFHRGHLAQATAPRCLLSLSHATMARQHYSGLRAGYRGTVACSSVCTVWLLLRRGRPGAPVPASAGTRRRLRPLGKLFGTVSDRVRHRCSSRHPDAAPTARRASRHCERPGAPQLLKPAPGCGTDRTRHSFDTSASLLQHRDQVAAHT